MKTFNKYIGIFLLITAIGGGLVGCATTHNSYHDPLYFNAADRTPVKYAPSGNSTRPTQNSPTESNKVETTTEQTPEYYRPAPERYLPSYQASQSTPNSTQSGNTSGGDTYITNNYYDSYRQSQNRRNRSIEWWQPTTLFFIQAAPAFYMPILPIYTRFGRNSFFSIGVGMGWNTGWGMLSYNPWFYSPVLGWYDPFYSYFGYYDPFWYGSFGWGWQNHLVWYSPYRNFYQVNNYYYGNNNSGGNSGGGGNLGGGRILPAQPRSARSSYAAGLDNNLPVGGRMGNPSGGRVAEPQPSNPMSGGRVGRTPEQYAPSTNISSYSSSQTTSDYFRPTRGTRGIENSTPTFEGGRTERIPQQNYQPSPAPSERPTYQTSPRASRSWDISSPNSGGRTWGSGGGSFSAPSRSGSGGNSGGGFSPSGGRATRGGN